MDNYKIPTNVKQIGNVDSELRVYIEDYVYSYLLQYAKVGESEESIAMLIGRCMIIDGKKVLFISGAIQGLHAETKRGILTFSEESLEYIEEQRLKHFKGLEIVGWMLSQPGYGTYLSTGHVNYHISSFKKPYQVMFVLDTVEKMNTFFQYSKEDGQVKEMEGFFIFYEKNLEMQEYISENKIESKAEEQFNRQIKIKKPEIKEVIKQEETRVIKKEAKQEVKKNNLKERVQKIHNEPRKEENKINVINIDKTKSINKVKPAKKPNFNFNQQVLAGGLALAVMATVAMNIVVSDNKITKLENDVNVLTEAYNLLVTHVNNSENVSQVFASSDTKVTTEKVEEMPKEDEKKTDVELQKETISVTELQNEVFVDVVENETNDEETNVETFAPSEIPEYYIVRQGDSLISISRDVYGTDFMQQKIMDANNIKDPNKIYFGMKLLLP